MEQQRSFSSNIGAIMAAVGSAVGLGNIWRFPYICGKYGGGAFLIVYLLFVFLIGMVLMMTEFVIGRRAQHTPPRAFESLRPDKKGWKFLGIFCIITCFFILAQYLVIAGWTTNYFKDSLVGNLWTLGQDGDAIALHFNAFSTSIWAPIIALVIFGAATAGVILGGVQKGIENASKILMPFLLLILLVLCVRSLTLPGASKGLEYLFNPDFTLLTGEGILAALGQALFSLSVGMGVMVVYGSYVPKKDNIFTTALWITASDTLIAVLAGVAIFPAVFSCGLEPAGGPGLVFQVLPSVFNSFGQVPSIIFGSLFFLLLMVAALTSAISLLECLMAWLAETTNSPRLKSTLIFTAAGIVAAALVSLGKNLFDLVDCLNTIYLLPICALGTVLFLGWVMRSEDVYDELSNGGKLTIKYYPVFRFLARYVAPLALLIVFITGILH